MLEKSQTLVMSALMKKTNEAYRLKESDYVAYLADYAQLGESLKKAVQDRAGVFVNEIRQASKNSRGVDSFLSQYSLSSEEGIALMCLAEALLRVPDKATIDGLIKDKLSEGDWDAHRGKSTSFFVNATTWALMLTGKVLAPEKAESRLSQTLLKLANRSGEGVLRKAVEQAMRIMSKQFVMGRTIEEALKRAQQKEAQGYLYSYDMLGEAALRETDAQDYMDSYRQSIIAIGKSVDGKKPVQQNPGISVKLSALHPCYHEAQKARVMKEMVPRVLQLAQLAKEYNIGFTIDAEESERLVLSLDIIEAVFSDPSLKGWEGFGLALQSYQKRAFYVIDWLVDLSQRVGRRLMVRLIKGAYWDSEIKNTQMQGLKDYPVFTRKVNTDVSFQACATKIMQSTQYIYPQFATHNAYSVAMILELVGDYRDFEFQCLHGMGDELYQQVLPKDALGIPCRIYAPVGQHEDLLPYLVRRLLENGANSSFVNRIVDEEASVEDLVADPIEKALLLLSEENPIIPDPSEIFSDGRQNSRGFDFSDRVAVHQLQQSLTKMHGKQWHAGDVDAVDVVDIQSPQNYGQIIGRASNAGEKEVEHALAQASKAFADWSDTPVERRAQCMERYADLLESHAEELYLMLCLEAGKTWLDAVAELREAVDFCRYYAQQARAIMAEPVRFQGYTGESNVLSLHARGTVLCISPWNFPLAIFTGQVVAALVTGNCVIAKPAEQTPLIAAKAVALMHKAGIPEAVVQLLTGPGETVGASLVADGRVKAVVFTGSTHTAQIIQKSLAHRGGEIIPLIAETGGLNAMIVDSSALLEQVTVDVLLSAFGSAGQRCSALRVLYLQEDIFDKAMGLISGAIKELRVGNPQWLETDVGPVIDDEALQLIENHIKKHATRILCQASLSQECEGGYFAVPTVIKLEDLQQLPQEIFGPVLHVVSYKKEDLDTVITDINDMGYGLTFGIHSRINTTVEYIKSRVHAGNCYVNRNMTGAIVGLQPFGGEGLSGTGPKAGGPLYLYRFCHERHCSTDTTAAGGNASLMAQKEV